MLSQLQWLRTAVIATKQKVDWTTAVWSAWRLRFERVFGEEHCWPDAVEFYQRWKQVRAALPTIPNKSSPRAQVQAVLALQDNTDDARPTIKVALQVGSSLLAWIRIALLSGAPRFGRADQQLLAASAESIIRPETFLRGSLVLTSASIGTLRLTAGHPANHENDSPLLVTIPGPWQGCLEIQPDWFVSLRTGSPDVTVRFIDSDDLR